MLTSVENFVWFATILVSAWSIMWFTVDSVNLRRELARDERNPDRVFGFIIGLVLAVLGQTGVLVYHYG